MSFRPGDLVVCIYDGPICGFGDERYPQKGEVCTVREVGDDGIPWLRTCEHINPKHEYLLPSGCFTFDEGQFSQKNFRPVVDSRIAIFRELLAPLPQHEREEA
jgi:hypothetical protein